MELLAANMASTEKNTPLTSCVDSLKLCLCAVSRVQNKKLL